MLNIKCKRLNVSRIHFTFYILLFTSATAFAAGKAGTSGANFLKLGAGARYAAMGEAAVAVADDINSLYWNPAQLSSVESASLSLMYGAYVESVNYQYAGYGRRLGNLGTAGLAAQTLSAGSIQETDDTGKELGSFSPRDMALSLGWGRRFYSRFPVGVSAKFIQTKILNSASTLAADVGLGYQLDKFSAAVAVRNLGGKLKYDQEDTDLPLTIQAGVAYRILSHWVAALDGHFPNDADSSISAGTEYGWHFSETMALFLRTGYNTRTKDVPGLQGITGGLGWRWSFLDVDYAWVPMGDVGQTHRVSMTMRFGGPAEKITMEVPRAAVSQAVLPPAASAATSETPAKSAPPATSASPAASPQPSPTEPAPRRPARR